MSREKQKLECEMAEMLEIIEKAREIYANDITDHTENEYIREGLLDAGYRKQRYGEWIEVDDGVLIGDGKHLECSECGVWKKDRQRSNFCSNCGAKSEVERLNAEPVRVQARHPFAMTLFELEACEKHAAIEAVKEVWRELRSMCDAPHWCVWLSEIDDYFEEKTGVKTEDLS